MPWESNYKDLLSALLTFYLERYPPVKVIAVPESQEQERLPLEKSRDASESDENARHDRHSSESREDAKGRIVMKLQTPVEYSHPPKQGDTFNTIIMNSLGLNKSFRGMGRRKGQVDPADVVGGVTTPVSIASDGTGGDSGYEIPFALDEKDFAAMMRVVNNTKAMIPFDLHWLGAFIHFYPPLTHTLFSVMIVPILRWFVGPLSIHLTVLDEHEVQSRLEGSRSNTADKQHNRSRIDIVKTTTTPISSSGDTSTVCTNTQTVFTHRHIAPRGLPAAGTTKEKVEMEPARKGAVTATVKSRSQAVIGIYVHKCRFLRHSREAHGYVKGNELCVKQCALAMEQIWRERVGVETWLEPDMDKGTCRVYAVPHPPGERYLHNSRNANSGKNTSCTTASNRTVDAPKKPKLMPRKHVSLEYEMGMEGQDVDYTIAGRWDGWQTAGCSNTQPNTDMQPESLPERSIFDW